MRSINIVKCALVFAAMALCSPAALADVSLSAVKQEAGANRIYLLMAADVQPQEAEQPQASPVPQPTDAAAEESMAVQVNALLESRFDQQRALNLLSRATARGDETALVHQTLSLYTDERVASVGMVWQGEQESGRIGSSAASLTIDLSTGEEILFDALFADADAAAAAMEAIIERDVLSEMSGYMEFAELLPMPRDCFSFDETGLTVYYQDDAYRYYDGRSGKVTFLWHELADYIAQDSPVYALSRPQEANAQAIGEGEGMLGEANVLKPGALLEQAAERYAMTDEPDYTRMSYVYTFSDEFLRGVSVEIPRYADTPAMQTPISAVRFTRISWHGLTTERTTGVEIQALLGEPDEVRTYDEDDAFDMLIDPGESLFYRFESYVLQAHLDEDGVLACVILREGMPENLY